jgi:secreted protein with Ig-like and vWFA domain
MLSGLRHALRNPVTGPVAAAVALVLAVAYGISASAWQAERAGYEQRISELAQASEKTQASLRTDLASCQAAGAARQVTEAGYAAATETPAGARRLLEQQPEGIDACARMESADRAVLSNLKQ